MTKLAEFGWGGDANPASQPQYEEDHAQDKQPMLHDEPDHEPGSAEYVFFYGGGQLHVSPEGDFTHDDLRGHAGVSEDHTGPTAVGKVSVDHGRATWAISGNVGVRSLHRILSDYTKHVGWRWHGLTDLDGMPFSDDFAPKKSRIIVDNETGERTKFVLQGKTAYVDRVSEGQADALRAAGYKLAEYPGGGNMNDRMRVGDPMGESLELYDRNPMNKGTGPTDLRDDRQPNGTFKCPACSKLFPNWQRYMDHREREEPMGDTDPSEDGKFPPLPNMDLTLVPRYEDNNHIVMPLASVKEAQRHSDWNEFVAFEGRRLYGAYRFGELRGVAVVQPKRGGRARLSFIAGTTVSKLYLLAAIQKHCLALDVDPFTLPTGMPEYLGMVRVASETYHWSAGQDPKDMIASPVPFIFDVQEDRIDVGQPGERHSDVEGRVRFTPGGIIEGTYEPGGKVILRNRTTMPYTVRHLIDLWYWTHPHMEVTSVEREMDDGSTTKLASRYAVHEEIHPTNPPKHVGWVVTEGERRRFISAHVNRDDAEREVARLSGIQKTAAEVGSYVKTIAATDPAVHRAYQALANEGGKVYAVGGVVRDALMQKEPKDIDLMVSGLPPEVVQHTLAKLPGRVDLTGKSFGVYRYNVKGHEVEIALPRTETSTGNTRKDFDVNVDHNLPVEDDLLRRDFTVNSMAVDLDNGKLVDPFGGAKDIEEGRLKTTHPSSFVEDPTRIMRALVMHGRYGFAPDEQTRAEMTQHADRLNHESWDNMNGIMEKIMQSSDPARAMRLAQSTGVMKHMFPEIHNNFEFDQNNPHHSYVLGDHLLNVLEGVSQQSKDPDLRMAAWLHDIGKPASQWTDPVTGFSHFYQGPNGEGADHETLGATMANARLKAIRWGSKARQDRITHLIQHHMWSAFSSPKGARKFLHKVGDENADDLMTLRWADQRGKGQGPEELAARTHVDEQRGLVEQVRSAQDPTSQSALAINGNDLIALGVKPGPAIGSILRNLTNDVIEDPSLNQPESLIERAKEYVNAQPA